MAGFKWHFDSRQTPAAGNFGRLRGGRVVFSTKFAEKSQYRHLK